MSVQRVLDLMAVFTGSVVFLGLLVVGIVLAWRNRRG